MERKAHVRIPGGIRRNPNADPMSMFPEPYRHEHRLSQYHQLSRAASINPETLHELRDILRNKPEMNLLSIFPPNYNRRINMSTGPKVLPPTDRDTTQQRPDFRTRLDHAETAKVVSPLSNAVTPLIAKAAEECPGDEGKTLATSLKRLIWDSSKLWEGAARGVVVQCSEEIVAKVVYGNGDYTEYTSMQLLVEHAPEIPVPRAHGLVALGPFRVIFMSLIPGITLAEAWPNLSHDEKSSIQQQLDSMFYRLRYLQQDSQYIGGVCGEGAKEPRISEIALFKDIKTTEEFSNLQFSARHHGSNTYVAFLRSLLELDNSLMPSPVFTHGDITTANIMVKQDSDTGQFAVTGIIDWEDSGFYPAYHECTTLSRTLSLVDEDDWYLYLPSSISPARYPIRWLVDRLWGIHLRTT